MTSEDIRLLIAVTLPCMTVLVGTLINNARISDLRSDMNRQFSDLRSDMNRRFDDLIRLMEARFQLQDEKLFRVEQVLDARLKHLEER